MGIFDRFKKTQHEPEASQEKKAMLVTKAVEGSVSMQKRATSDVIVRPLVTEVSDSIKCQHVYFCGHKKR